MSLYVVYQVFDWVSVDRKTKIHFRVSELLKAIDQKTISFDTVTTPLDLDWATSWLDHSRIETAHIERLKRMANTHSILYDPALSVAMPGGSYLLIDGSHRYAARLTLGMIEINMFLVEEPVWRPFAEITGNWPPTS